MEGEREKVVLGNFVDTYPIEVPSPRVRNELSRAIPYESDIRRANPIGKHVVIRAKRFAFPHGQGRIPSSASGSFHLNPCSSVFHIDSTITTIFVEICIETFLDPEVLGKGVFPENADLMITRRASTAIGSQSAQFFKRV